MWGERGGIPIHQDEELGDNDEQGMLLSQSVPSSTITRNNNSIADFLETFPVSYQQARAATTIHFIPLVKAASSNSGLRSLNRGFKTPDPSSLTSRQVLRDNDPLRSGRISPGRISPKSALDLKTLKKNYGGVQPESHSSQWRASPKSFSTKSQSTTPPAGTLTVTQSTFSLINILLGVGILTIPYSLVVVGSWQIAVLFIIVPFSLATATTSILIGQILSAHPGSPSFTSLTFKAYGPAMSLVVSVLLYFELFSCLSIFITAMADHLHGLHDDIDLSTWHFIVVGVLLPNIFIFDSPSSLSRLSAIGTTASLLIVFSVVLYPILYDVDPPPITAKTTVSGFSTSLGLAAYCFSGHAILPSIYSSLENKRTFPAVVASSYIVVLIAMAAVGGAGLLSFGSEVKDQVTLSMGAGRPDSYWIKALGGVMVVTTFSKFFLTLYPLVLGVSEVLTGLGRRGSDKAIALSMLTGSYVFATAVPGFGALCSLVGLVCTMAISLIAPALLHLKLVETGWMGKIVDVIIILGGAVAMIFGTWQVVLEQF
ncbi:hypothetical protein TrCOL_g2768 [Triparma columacea]|uniref:Amino acid transporter transmembrane domain-containing protein n=1 Tax=Triparma columacea TaxID=722753 RepID=A0A9W7GK95_9STRA|nr:hypothetical protein TrCOL_g2768 [Triparma columacea]